ncbi:hypothetical protein, partial [Oceanicella sp. SM1341]|uniref:head-tail joining protein n=1 Tax=Oceanicella sp. SM1341 TaxID=1548889 RepID=UPI000E4BC895
MALFDGLTGLLDDVFGAQVTVTPPAGAARPVQAVFREGPVTVLGAEGQEVTTVLPTLSGARDKLAALVPGGTVRPGNGKTYRCISALPSGSPADDARMTI